MHITLDTTFEFTEEDIKQLPDFVTIIENPNAYQPEGENNTLCGFWGKYIKTVDGNLYGVVILQWGYTVDYSDSYNRNIWPDSIDLYRVNSTTYVLVETDGTAREISMDEFNQLHR